MFLRPVSYSNRHRKLTKLTSRPKRKLRLWLMLLLTVSLWLGYRQAKGYFRQPQAMLVLGGAPERELFAANFAREHPHLPIWVSSGSNPEFAEWAFAEAGIDLTRVHLDYRAVDTVTNFTTLVDDLQTENINSVYLITSDYHMRRACMIGHIILNSRDISFEPVVVPSEQLPETLGRTLRDGARAIFWILTGQTGSELTQVLKSR
ncbi:MAG: YdcF family protein [Cyanothece sp. SIO1E1]|nr:YdcF family protein [Cyanothece sp. SIO1E1]